MASLIGQTPADTYDSLLHLESDTSGLTAALKTVESGDGATSPLKLSTANVDTGSALLADVIGESTTDAGVTIDGLLIKDGAVTVGGNITGDSADLSTDDAAASGVTNVLKVGHTTSGTPAAGIGVGMEFEAETAAGNNEIGAVLEAVTTDVTAASEDFDFSLKLMTAGAAAAEVARFTSTGALNVDIINEKTAANGIAIDGVTLKDGGITASTQINQTGGVMAIGNTTSSTSMSGPGLIIDQEAFDDAIIIGISSDVAHGQTDSMPTDHFFRM
jgi:hypothetical protein